MKLTIPIFYICYLNVFNKEIVDKKTPDVRCAGSEHFRSFDRYLFFLQFVFDGYK